MMGLVDVFSGFRGSPLVIALAAIGLIGGCATPPDPSDTEAAAEYREINDPAEPLNRAIFSLNRGLDTMFLKPTAEFYGGIVPPPVQEGVHNALNNLRTPVILANDLLQGDLDRAGATVMRFIINTTYGVGGIIDQATDLGYEYHGEDFGQTLAVWGVGEGPYLMLPIIGPSNPRDGIGFLVDMAFDPFFWWSYNTDTGDIAAGVKTGANVVDFRTRNYDALEDLEKSSLDFYTAVRSLYRQRRKAEISNGDPSLSPTPGFGTLPAHHTVRRRKSVDPYPVRAASRRRFLAGLVTALLAPAAIAAASAGSTGRAEQFIRDLAEKGIELLTEEGLAHDERVRRVRALMSTYFDIGATGRWVLGRHWRRATPAERQEFLTLFEDWIALGYAARFGEYAGQSVHVVRSVDLGNNMVAVRSEVVQPGGTERILVDWRVRENAGSLRIIDVAVEGTSMSQTVRSDFGSTVRQGGGKVSALIGALRDKVDALKSAAASP